MGTDRLRIIVTGLIAQYPLGGVTWDYIQYVLGLDRLGHDVYYIEDTHQWPYNPEVGGLAKDCTFNVNYLANVMSRYGLENKWAYCFPWTSQWFGLREKGRQTIIETADLLINVSGTLARPQDYRQVQRLVYIDSDPVFTQIKLARRQAYFRKLVDAHDVHFTFGECLSSNIPQTGHDWRPTRQPILLSEWRSVTPQRAEFTTIMNWTSHNDVVYNNQTYGQKDSEFMQFIDLPGMVKPTVLELAVNVGKTRHTPRDLLANNGWRVVDPDELCSDMDSYRRYIESSKAEWSVAKNGYVRGQPGWFSCRSACYLAAGKPVVVQDTGFSSVLPVGRGILPFRNMDEAVASIHEVESSYEQHSKAARALAEEYFNSDKVLTKLIEEVISNNG